MKRKITTGFMILMLIMTTLLGCAPEQKGDSQTSEQTSAAPEATQASSEPQKKSRILRVALSSDPGFDHLDNILTTSAESIQADAMVYEGLVKYGPKGELLPSVAESWYISEDGKSYTFHLRQGVSFTDGSPVNAEAVKFSFERWVNDPKKSSVNIARLLERIETPDAQTVVFHFTENYYPLLTEFSYPRPVGLMSLNSVEPAGDPSGTFVKPIGCGPWMIDSYKKDQEAVLVSNPNYWGEASEIDKIIFSIMPDPQARIYALQNGEIDITGGGLSSVSIDSLPSLEDNADIELKQYPSTQSYFTIFNYENPLLKDLEVRKAMNMLLDKEAMVTYLMNGIGKPAKALFQADVPYTTEENSRWYPFNVEAAKEILEEAGYILNQEGIREKDGKPLSFKMVFSDKEYTEWKAMAEYMQSQFLEAGIQLNLDNREIGAYYDSLWKDRDYDLIIYRTYSDSWNPHGFLLSLFTGTTDAPAVAWQDSELTEMIETVLSRNTDADRQAGYDDIYQKMFEEACYIPLYYPDQLFLIRRELKNVEPGFDSYAPLQWTKIRVE